MSGLQVLDNKLQNRDFSAAAGTEEEDGVVAGVGDGVGDEVRELAVIAVGRGLEGCVSEGGVAEPAPEKS